MTINTILANREHIEKILFMSTISQNYCFEIYEHLLLPTLHCVAFIETRKCLHFVACSGYEFNSEIHFNKIFYCF